MSGQIKIGVVGAGKMGALHLQKYLGFPDVELVGFYDADPLRSAWATQTFGVAQFDSLADLLFEVDAVSIASTTSSHYSIARQAFEAGVHVLVEKPLTEKSPEAEDLIRIAHQRKLVLQVGFIERFRYVSLSRAFPVSPVRFVECHRLSPNPGRESNIDVVSDLMIHDLDLALSLMGGEPSYISAFGISLLSPFCDLAQAHLEFPGGGIANLTASRVAAKPFRVFKTFSAKSYASMDFISNSVELCFADGQGGLARKTVENSPFDALNEQLLHFVSCVRNECEPIVSGNDGLRALKVAEIIKRKISELSNVEGPETPLQERHDFKNFFST